jgi:predicted membrane chloride channel (bestrophin family)
MEPAPAPVPVSASLPSTSAPQLPKKVVEQVVEKTRIAPMSDTGDNYERVPWWKQSSTYSEEQRKDRRTIFMHDEWVRHRSSERFLRNILSIGSSGINQALFKELAFMISTAVFVVVFNMLFVSYQDFGGVSHPGPLNFLDADFKAMSLPAQPFSIVMPALSLLLVFRTNTGYFRWNEARTLWGGLINNCRNVVRQTNTFFPDDARHNMLKRRMAAETAAFIKALRNFLRGPTDDATLRYELYDLVDAGLMTPAQADETMRASNRPMFCLSAMSATLRKADLDPMHSARIDTSISVLVDLTGANERIFKSPIPLVYTRLTSRFLIFFLLLLPLALWGQLGESWNHWATIPAEFLIAFFLFGIEEVGIQIEEPFSILPLEAFCNGAIAATSEEMLKAVKSGVFDDDP